LSFQAAAPPPEDVTSEELLICLIQFGLLTRALAYYSLVCSLDDNTGLISTISFLVVGFINLLSVGVVADWPLFVIIYK